MLTVLCRDWIRLRLYYQGETEEEILKNGAEHVMTVHGMQSDDICLNRIPANLLCQTISKLEGK
jgi:hypothetical protein